MALGAKKRDLVSMVTAEGMKLVASGIACGAVIAFAMGRILSSLVYGVSVHDGTTFAAAALVAAVAGIASCYVPARRATKADPCRRCVTSERAASGRRSRR